MAKERDGQWRVSNRFAPDSATLSLRYAGPTPKTSKRKPAEHHTRS